MSSADSLILVVNREADAARNLKSLIEFMDTPAVCTATPGDWQQRIGDRRLEALFVGADLSDPEVEALLQSVRELDPNVPIVMMKPGGDS